MFVLNTCFTHLFVSVFVSLSLSLSPSSTDRSYHTTPIIFATSDGPAPRSADRPTDRPTGSLSGARPSLSLSRLVNQRTHSTLHNTGIVYFNPPYNIRVRRTRPVPRNCVAHHPVTDFTILCPAVCILRTTCVFYIIFGFPLSRRQSLKSPPSTRSRCFTRKTIR